MSLNLRNLLSIEYDDEDTYCINGYILPDTNECICYPGWDSISWSIYKCTYDMQTNATKTKSDKNVEASNEEESAHSDNSYIIKIFFFLFLFFGCIIISCIFLCFYSKWKKIKLIKQKIKYEKEKTKKLESGVSLNVEQSKEMQNSNKINEKSDEEETYKVETEKEGEKNNI